MALGLVDGLVKGTAPVLVANYLGYSEWVQAAAGLGAVGRPQLGRRTCG